MEQPTIFTRLKEIDEDAITLFIAGNKALKFFTQPVLDEIIVHNSADNIQVAEDAKGLIIKHDFDLMFINLGYQDIIGHKSEWMSGSYLEAVRQADDAIRVIFETLSQMEYLDNTMVIITADHGGKGITHSLGRLEDETIPLIFFGPCIKKGYQFDSESREIKIMDIAPTILYALGIEITEDIEGQVIIEAFIDYFE